ncbi:50S ribosomal protein L1 [Candidatus Gracilibacteria bacterium]|nr:50S ribosomal protein L1 [Candidatus Gracilibacteria bacterium]MCF7819456.1 50S ribosomal protein L1 [Candidatus Gracilibacteria bacterium]
MKKSKSLRAAYEKLEEGKLYSPSEAIKLMKKTSTVKFDPTAEVHFNLGINPKHADQQVRSTVSLPHGTGKKVRVAVFCGDDKVKAAKSAGAIEAGGDDLIQKVSGGWLDFDVAVATPPMMKELAKIARILGPKGLMPNPKAGTVTEDVEKTVSELAAGRLEFRNDKNGLVHTIFGKLSFDEKKLIENLEAMIKAIQDIRPTGVKGVYIKSVTVTSTMGPGIKVSISE